MSEYATHGATLICSCGAFPTQLLVTSNTVVSIQGNAVATAADKKTNVNIMPFGKCSSTNKPCSPALMPWMGFVASVQIPGGNPLLNTSMAICSNGGCIKFQDSGQKKPNKVETHPSSKQITALKNAAINAIPFSEECEQKQQEKKIRAVDVYWKDEESDERHYDLFPDYEVTLCIETIDYTSGENLTLDIYPEEGKRFKGGADKIVINGNVNSDGVVYIQKFKVEYEEDNQ